MRTQSIIGITLLAASMAVPAAGAAAERVSRVTAPGVAPSGLDSRWVQMLNAEAGTEREVEAYDAVVSAMRELGLVEMPAHATVLLQDASGAAERGDLERATVLRERARGLAPDLAEGHFFDARRTWATTPWRVREVTAEIAAGYAGLRDTVAGRSVLGILWRELVAWWAALLACVIGLALAVRHGGRVAHDLRLALFRTLTLGQSAAVVVFAAVAPALILWSPFAFVVCAIAVTSLHLGLVERVLALLVVGGLVAAPWLASEYGTLVVGHEPGASRVVSAVVGPCDDRCIELLGDAYANDGDADAAVAQAWALFKRGTPEHRERAMQVLDGLEPGPAAASSAAVLRGNQAFMEGDTAAAEEAYLRAHGLAVDRTQRAASLYNLYRVHSAEDLRPLAQEALRGALAEDEAFVSHYLEDDEARTQNRVLAVSPIPAAAVGSELLAGAADDAVAAAADQFLRPWYGQVAPALTYPAAAGLVLLLVIGVFTVQRRLVSKRCSRCGTPVSRLVLEPAYEANLCILCYQLVAASDQLTRDQLDLREARIERWAEAAPKLSLAANIACPGLGVLISGRTVRGVLLALAFTGAVALLVVRSPVDDLTFALGGARGLGGQGLLAGALLVLAYPPALWLSRRAGSAPAASHEEPAASSSVGEA